MFCLLVEPAATDTLAVLEAGARHADFYVRMQVAETISNQQVLPCLGILHLLAGDHHHAVRQRASLALWKYEEDKVAVVIRMLEDASLAIREQGRWCAKQINFAVEHHLEARIAELLQTGESLSPALLDLVAVSNAVHHLPLVAQALGHPQAAIRRAALLAYLKLSRQTAEEPVVMALSDLSMKTFRLAQRIISRGDIALSLAQSHQAALSNWCAGQHDRALGILKLQSYWDRLEGLLYLAGNAKTPQEENRLRDATMQSLRAQGMYLRSPDPVQKERLKKLFTATSQRIFPTPDSQLIDILAKFGIIDPGRFERSRNGIWS